MKAAVISVGNITAGGTGKTPLVIWLCNFFKQQNIPIAVLTRGYKTQGEIADEPDVIAENCPDIPVIVNPDRIAGAKEAIERHKAKVLILDDGFQHRRLFRDLDIVTIDATEPFGFGKLLPAGLLREPISSLTRADAFVITRSDLINRNELIALEQSLKEVNPNILIIKSEHQPLRIITSENNKLPLEHLKGKKVFAFCGIGNPDSFRKTLEIIGATVLGCEIFNDHYHYAAGDISLIGEKANKEQAEIIITTQKDWTKIKNLNFMANFGIPSAYLKIGIAITEDEDKFRRLISETVSDKI